MKSKKTVLCSLIILLAGVIYFPAQAQQKANARVAVEIKEVPTSPAPKGIVRTIKQDKKGNIWITSWEGVYKYDGKSFTNITSKASSARFFSVLGDRKGNLWFGSIGSGLYYYDGKSFQHFTTKDGLAGNEVTNMYEDKTGAIWFGTGNGASRYDGTSFRSFKMSEALPVAGTDSGYVGVTAVHTQADSVYVGNDSVYVGADSVYHGTDSVYHGTDSVYHGTDSVYHGADSVYHGSDSVYHGTDSVYHGADSVYVGTDSVYHGNDSVNVGAKPVHNQADSVRISYDQHSLPKIHWTHNDVNAIIEDKTGKFWFGTRGYATLYDGKTFTTITNSNGKPFTNVRSIIKDKKGNIWLGGADGLWRFDGNTFTNFTQHFVGYIYEDKKGNIWTSSEISNGVGGNSPVWAVSRFDEKSLSDKKPTVTEIAHKPMTFGILEDSNGNIWFGALDGVYRYDGKIITAFKNAAGQK